MEKLKKLDVRVCVDTVGEAMQLALKAGPDIIKPNKEELSDLMGRRLSSVQEVLCAAQELVDSGIGLVAVSMGADGAVFVTKDSVLRGYCPKVSVASTVGAGDAMMAALAHYTAAGCSLEETARRSIAVATASVMCSGSQPAELDKILPLIDKKKKTCECRSFSLLIRKQ